MNFPNRAIFASVVTLSFAGVAAEEAAAPSEVRHVIARADVAGVPAGTSHAPAALDAYAGRYDAAADVAFVVDRDGDALSIELPKAYGGSAARLQAAEARNTFTTQTAVRVVFDSDANGKVLGMTLHLPNEVIVASKAQARRGVVTIHDLSEEAISTLRLDSLARSF